MGKLLLIIACLIISVSVVCSQESDTGTVTFKVRKQDSTETLSFDTLSSATNLYENNCSNFPLPVQNNFAKQFPDTKVIACDKDYDWLLFRIIIIRRYYLYYFLDNEGKTQSVEYDKKGNLKK